MAGGGNLFGRVLSYVVNEFIVEGLANNFCVIIWSLGKINVLIFPVDLFLGSYFLCFTIRTFQRFAVRTNKSLENLSSKAKEVREELSEQWRNSRGNDDHFRQ
ncbi:hypothetical protein OsI_16574 [Oryza sativa Indica Group]|uniref:Uncharacterized protein n=1 Tax=Oryza sativa subsp. indica TaxID=39946 RepID=B8ARN4_ORYSI|nr:hypothetical protein OsI_16574 [Oryza sativa Indica Group]